MLEVLVVEPTQIIRSMLESSFTKFDAMMQGSLRTKFTDTGDSALTLIDGSYWPTDLVIDTDLVPFSAYSGIISVVKKVRTFAFGERDSLQFHQYAKGCKLPYEFVQKSTKDINALPYMIALNKQSC